jgi:putative transposase
LLNPLTYLDHEETYAFALYGTIEQLQVPKLRERNSERQWQILERYQRSLGNLLDWMCCLYVMGLSLRDLQEALYFVVGRVLSVNAVNQITLQVQRRLEERARAPLSQTSAIILVDGVWVDIQFVIADEYKEDLSGHLRQRRQVELECCDVPREKQDKQHTHYE